MTLRVNCVETIAGVTAQVIGNWILLRTDVAPPEKGIYVACQCERLTEIRLSGLPREHFRIFRIGSPWLQLSHGESTL